MQSHRDILGQMIYDAQQPKLRIKKLDENAIIPNRGSKEAAVLDLYALEDLEIKPEENLAVHTGIAMSLPNNYVGLIFARSGLATKQQLRPANCVGVVDSDYRGEVIVNLMNDNPTESRKISAGDRVAQMVITSYIAPEIIEVDELDTTERGDKGFGSTGK